ncbi:HAMP domain-containing methyl-accepting chemotaxis protein [Tuwongella immobilis]|uniref:Methyl-accepting chemotaxis protein n=1 Tax=Tuwongella immobilis TaxID=692036 RepID=A0A6C2YLJ7_9BACT
MKNWRISTKMIIIIAVMALTSLSIAAVGYYQFSKVETDLNRMIDTTADLERKSMELRILVGATLLQERAALLTDDPQLAAKHAKESLEKAATIDTARATLPTDLEKNGFLEEAKLASQFENSWERCAANQQQVLKIGLENSLGKARESVKSTISPRIRSWQNVCQSVREAVLRDRDAILAAKDLDKLIAMEGKLRIILELERDILELPNWLTTHINTRVDEGFEKIEARITELQEQIDRNINNLLTQVDGPVKPLVERLSKEFLDMRPQFSEVIRLSRIDSNAETTKLLAATEMDTINSLNALKDLTNKLHTRLEVDSDSLESMTRLARNLMLSVPGFGITISIFLALTITRGIVRPLAKGVELSSALADGDLTRRLKLDRRDEVGLLTNAMDRVADAFGHVLTDLSTVATGINGSANQLDSVSKKLLTQSDDMSSRARHVAVAAEQMTTNINMMAGAAEQMSINMISISSASEEISVNVGMISKAAEQTSDKVTTVTSAIVTSTRTFENIAREAREETVIADRAREMANHASGTMSHLDRAAGEIGKVSETIKMIALQTNLLALNATIEATAAGDAGKGFAVVAHEIKELATQSARAAEDITRKIEAVQTSTRDAVRAIESVSEVINQLSAAASTIRVSVEEQSVLAKRSSDNLGEASHSVGEIANSISEVSKGTTEMSRNAGEAAKGANDVSRNAAEAAQGVREITAGIQQVSQSSQQTSLSAKELTTAATQLQKISGELQAIVKRFRLEA